jgi:hypothetical protein
MDIEAQTITTICKIRRNTAHNTATFEQIRRDP